MKYQLPFGTHGIRGNANIAPFTPDILRILGLALESFLTQQTPKPIVLIASDTRESCPRIQQNLCLGFSHKTTVRDAGIIPTPTLITILTQNAEFDCGIMITASHNPSHDNGLKFFLRNGTELTHIQEQELQNLFECNLYAQPPTTQCITTGYSLAYSDYLEQIKPHFKADFLRGITIGLDCANGSTSQFAPAIFSHFGATIFPINNAPNGKNINTRCGSTHPTSIQNLVKTERLDYGFAFDGDGDRVITVNSQGELKDGDDVLVMLAANSPKTQSKYTIGTIASNSALSKALSCHNSTLITSNVGEHAVITAMKKHNAAVGAEPSGHIIIKKHLMASDGIFAALSILQAAIEQNNPQLETFKHNPHASQNILVTEKIPLSNPALQSVLEEHKLQFPKTHQLVRYSGTESLLRIYIEAETEALAKTCTELLAQKLTAIILQLSTTQTPSQKTNAQRTA